MISNKYGEFEIVEALGKGKVLIEFKQTGYRTEVLLGNAKKGKVKDRLLPNVQGVGYVGDGSYIPSKDGSDTPAYVHWFNMLRRCYDSEYHKERPTYIDCTVCDEWHNFQVFAEWFYNVSNYENGLQLDKDYRVKGNKVYSPNTCIFLTLQQNTVTSSAKECSFISPDGDVIDVFNLSDFCRENDLSKSCMNRVSNGKRKSHKGWIKYAG